MFCDHLKENSGMELQLALFLVSVFVAFIAVFVKQMFRENVLHKYMVTSNSKCMAFYGVKMSLVYCNFFFI